MDLDDPYGERPIEEIPALPIERGIPILYSALSLAVDLVDEAGMLNACLVANRTTIELIRRHRPGLFDQLQARVQPLRLALLRLAIAGAVDLAALERILELHRPSITMLGRSRQDLLAELEITISQRRAALTAAAA